MPLKPFDGELDPIPKLKPFNGDLVQGIDEVDGEVSAGTVAGASLRRKAGQTGIAAGNILDDAGIKTGIGDAGREVVANNMPAVSSLEDIAESPIDAAVQAASETPVDMGINLAGRAAGAGIGGFIGRRIGMGAQGAKLGEEVGGWLTSSAQSYGGIREEQKAEGIDSIPRALLAAGASGLVETAVGPERLISKYVKGGGKLAPGASRATNAVAEAGKAALGEGATEYVQSQIEQVGSGQDPFTVEGQKQAAFEGVMGAAGGGVIGGGVGAAAPREAVRPPQNTEEMMAQLATGQIPNAKIDSLIPAAPGAAQNETATAGPMERVVNQNQEILDAAGQAVQQQRDAAAQVAVERGDEGQDPTGAAAAGSAPDRPGAGSVPTEAGQAPSVGANLSAQPAQPAQPEALPFTPDPSRGPLSRAVATAVDTGAIAGPKSDVIAIPGQGQPAQQPLIIPGQQPQSAQQPIQVAEQPQSLRSRMSYDAGQRAAEEQAMQAEAEARAKPKSRVAEQPQFEERRSNLNTPFKTELAAKAAARRPDNAGFTPTKLSANEWVLRREVPKQDLPPSYSRFENPEYSNGQASLDGSASAAAASPQSQDSGQPRFSNAAATIDVDGEQLPSTNSRGKPIAPDEESTRNFWRSFKGTKVADDQGRPIEVYHGTDWPGFDEFDGRETAGWFTEDAGHASNYAVSDRSNVEENTGGELKRSPNVVPSYLSIKNPLVLDFDMNDAPDGAFDVAGELGARRGDFGDEGTAWEVVNSARFMSLAEGAGFDGVRVKEDGKWTWSPIKAGQIKSSTGNRGTFDTSNPDIRFSSRASISDRRGTELSVSGGPVDEVMAGTLGASARGKPGADTAAAPAKSGKGWNDRPVQPDAVSLTGVHYTNTAGLKALDGRYYGTNHKGAESRRLSGLKGEKGKLLRNRIGFYPEGSDLAKTGESMVGRADVHRVQLDNLYDIDADPRGLKAKVDKPGMSDDDFYNALDLAIIKEGFDGIYVPKSRMIYLLGTRPVPVGARASQKPEIKERGAEASRPRNAMRADVIRRLADPITKSWSVKVNIVDTPEQFPDAVKAAPGFSQDLSEAVIFGDEIYIAASQVGTVKDLYRLLAHEGVAHAGVEKMAGKQWPQLVKEINKLLDKGGWLAKEVAARYPKADADTRAAEAIALMAERGVRSGIMSRLVAAARKFARDLGFNVQFTDRDLRDMIAAAARQMNSGKPRAEIRMSNQPQTETEAFKRWFGDSKVVDEDGKPLVVYHGGKSWTRMRTDEERVADFDKATKWAPKDLVEVERKYAVQVGGAVWFTDHEGVADGYADGRETMSVYVSMQNPLDLRKRSGQDVDAVLEAAGMRPKTDAYGYNMDVAHAIVRDNGKLLQYARENGYDGLIYPDTDIRGRGTHTSYVVLKPGLVKSATDNHGTFDPSNPDIRFSNQVEPGYEVEELDFLDFADVAGLSGGEQTSAALVAKAQEAWREMGTDSPFFRDWFGKSKFKKADGTPVPLYHATNADFEAFDPNRAGESTGYAASGLGIFMTPKRSAAERYGDKVLKLYARIEKPYIMSPEESGSFDSVAEARKRREQLMAAGYDGIFIKEDGTTIAFQPQQVKAADNRGTFDLDDVRMRFSNRVGPVVNIGLDVNDGSKLTKDEAIAALQSTGARVLHHRLKQSSTEQTLIAKLDRGLTPEEAFKVSADLRQDAIAQLAGRNTGLFGPEAAKWGDFNKDYFLRFSKKREALNPDIVQTLGKHIRNLLPAERAKLRRDTAERLVNQIQSMPSASEMAAVAYAGRAKRGWYWNSARAIEHVFGGDAPRFAGLLAALSPQCSVETNLYNTLSTWKNWVSAGRPTDREAIIDVMAKSVQGGRGRASVLDAWINNSVRALSAEDPSTITLSGPKVNSFMLNLRGYVDEVTNDAWMANYALVNQQIFSGSLTKGGDPGKSSGYLAMSAQVRAAAKKLTQLTGEEWTPAEVQETVWSWAKTLYESASVKKSAEEIVADRAITDEMINSTPDFRTLFHDEVNENLLTQAGLGDRVASLRSRQDLGGSVGQGAGAEGQAAPFAPEAQLRHETRAAKRLDELRVREYPEDARFSNKPAFYSALLRSVKSGTMPKKAGPAAYKQWLDGAQRRGEFKQSERDWLGVDAWLDGQKEVTRDQLTEFVRANQVEVQETVLREPLLPQITEGRSEAGAVKFAQYTLPGGQNYRELLLTMPEQGRIKYTADNVVPMREGFEVSDPLRFWYFRALDNVFQIPKSKYATESDALNYVLREKQPEAPAGKNFRSSHFDQPNILAHVRFNERTDADGKRVLFVEEVQSDWHQEGRKKGYAGPDAQAKFEAAQAHYREVKKNGGDLISATIAMDKAQIAAAGVPDAPFKKEWPLTAMKRMIRYASENGFDRIAWTTGAQQADRYDLSKQVDSISYAKTGDDQWLISVRRGGSEVLKRTASSRELEDIVGKDVAKKIVDGAGREPGAPEGSGELRGLDLKIGGDGMRAFYDKMLPNELGKYVKKWGGKVGTTSIIETDDGVAEYEVVLPNGKVVKSTANRKSAEATARDFDGAIVRQVGGTSVPSIDITPAMREAALQGQPLFSNKPTLRERFEDALYTTKTFNAWHNTVGTQYHKAQVDADFRAVYEKGQDFLNDVSRIAMESADHAPSLLPKLESLRDVLKRGPSTKDLEALSNAVFTGTLEDETVYTDDELRGRFDLNDKQIGLYREFRAAIDASLDELNASEIVRITRDLVPQVAGQIRANPAEAARTAIDALGNVGTPAALDQIQIVFDRQVKIDELKMKGYAPLMRFGRYTVYVTDGAEQIYFGTFESEADATRVKREMQDAYPQATVRQGVMSQEAWKQFKGISPDTLELFAEGAGLSYGEAFQEYLRLAKNNRSAMKRLIRRKGVAGFERDASRVLASFITSNARAASTGYHLADMQRAAAAIDKERGDVKDEAVKLAEYIQNPQEEAGALRGFLFTQFIGGSLASAVTNMTQPVMMTFPWLSQFAGTGAAAKHLASAGAVAAGQTPNDPDLRAALERATKDGVVAPHEIHQLYAESMRNFGSNPMIRKGLKVWGSFFSLAESFNRRISFVAAYNAAKEMGDEAVAMAGFRDAYDFAVNAVEATQGVYNRGNRPNWARGAIGATVFTFKQYSISYLEFMKRLPIKERALALGILVLASGLQGLPGAEDLEDLIDTIGQSLGYNTNSKKAMRENLINALGEDFGGFVAHGASSFTPIDVQARMGLGNLIPGTSALKRSTTDRGRDALEAIGPVGGLIKQVMDSFSRVQAGDLSGAAASLAPLAVQNAVKGVTMATTGQYNDTQGRKVVDTTIGDAVAKGIGFQPASVADVQRTIGGEQQDINMVRNVQSDIADAWAQALAAGDPAGVRTAVARMRDWNSKNPETPISIDRRQLIARVKAIKSTKAERTLKATPGQLKGGVAQALGQ